jgi:hypothetical protein
MIARYAIMIVILLAVGTARAESLDADAARRFVLGKLFAFTCFDGSRGAGRVYGDGSVIGTIQVRGSGPVHSVWLPAGTLRSKARQSALRSTVSRSSHALISTGRMIKVSAAQFRA